MKRPLPRSIRSEVWRDQNGRKRYGYVNADTGGAGGKWELGQVAFQQSYIDEKTFAQVNQIGGLARPERPQALWVCQRRHGRGRREMGTRAGCFSTKLHR